MSSMPTLDPEARVPRLRRDLTIYDAPAGTGEGRVKVESPASGAIIELRGFELSIARMLNGTRTVNEVVQAAGQIGLPISVDSLTGFVSKLSTLGFLEEIAPGPGPSSPDTGGMWQPRNEWGADIRALFQTALREARSDRPEAARKALTTILQRQPGTKEAEEFLAWLDAQPRGADGKPQTFANVFSETEQSWFRRGERESAINEEAQQRLDEAVSDLAPQRSSGRPLKIVLALIVAATLAGVALVPTPVVVKAPCTVTPKSSEAVKAPVAGTMEKLEVAAGQWIDKGAPLWRYEASEAQKTATELEAKKAKLEAAATLPAKAAPLEAKLKSAGAAVEKAQAALDAAKAKAKGKKTPAVKKAMKKVSAAQKAEAKAKKAWGAVAGKALAARKQLEALAPELAKAKADVEAALVAAPVAGFVERLQVKPGEKVEAGGVVLVLEDSKRLSVKSAPPAMALKHVKAGQSATLNLDGKNAKATVESVDAEGVHLTLDNPKGDLKPGDGELTIQAGSATVLSRFL